MDYVLDEYGNRCTYLDGKLHSYDDKPAVISPDDTQLWYKNGKRHRDNDLPAVIYADSEQWWFQNDKLHRDNVKDSSFTGPAKIYANGDAEWWIGGVKIKECDKYQPKVKSARAIISCIPIQ